MIYSFKNDYSVVAHPEVLKKICECCLEQNIGYGEDIHTKNAIDLIKQKLNNDNVDIYFLAGGTQTNLVGISYMLKPYQAVICVETGHINVHETGAIEGTGHKILTTPGVNGKITVSEIEAIVLKHTDNHMVEPKLVYISNTTEIGTIYSKEEIKEISDICKKYDLFLYLDGARLASALANSDLKYEDLCHFFDAFYIGGTKNGAYFGEALVVVNDIMKKGLNYYIKNKGALLAKGFFCSMAFEVLMKDDLYISIGASQNKCALYLASEFTKLGINLAYPPQSNQIFPIFTSYLVNKLVDDYQFEIIDKISEDEIIVRFVTSFDTTTTNCEELISHIRLCLLEKNA